MIESGNYTARALRANLATKGAKNTPLVAVTFSVPEHGTIEWDGWLTEAAVDRTFEALRYCGWVGDDVRDLSGIEANEVEIVVELEEFQGRTHPRVKWVNALGGRSSGSLLSPETAAAIAAGLKGKAIASRKAPGAAPRPASKPKPAPVAQARPTQAAPEDTDDSDIHF